VEPRIGVNGDGLAFEILNVDWDPES